MSQRCQRTLARPATIAGRSLFHGWDVRLLLLPAPEHHGIVFQRVDLPARVRIPAHVDYVVGRPRRTVLSRLGAQVETVEHVMAALAGLQIDNCLVQLDAPECPNGDGSALAFVEAIEAAGIATQAAPAPCVCVSHPLSLRDEQSGAEWRAFPPDEDSSLRIGYELLAPCPGCPRQELELAITPETFVSELSWARTFVLESEVAALRAQGLGLRTTARDLLVFDANGCPVDNELRRDDECVRHKLLDCVGDFALAGAAVRGRFSGLRTGHRHNHELVRRLRAECCPPIRDTA